MPTAWRSPRAAGCKSWRRVSRPAAGSAGADGHAFAVPCGSSMTRKPGQLEALECWRRQHSWQEGGGGGTLPAARSTHHIARHRPARQPCPGRKRQPAYMAGLQGIRSACTRDSTPLPTPLNPLLFATALQPCASTWTHPWSSCRRCCAWCPWRWRTPTCRQGPPASSGALFAKLLHLCCKLCSSFRAFFPGDVPGS